MSDEELKFPASYDPFQEDLFDPDPYYYSPETNAFGYDSGEQFVQSPLPPENVAQIVATMPPGVDPTPSLRQALDAMMNPQPQEREDTLPVRAYSKWSDGCLFFDDSVFARMIICSEQNIEKMSEAKGFCLIPCRYLSRMRSKTEYSRNKTKLVYVPEKVAGRLFDPTVIQSLN